MLPEDYARRAVRNAGTDKVKTILLVEDDATVRELVAYLLESEGYHVLKARHSQEALHFGAEHQGKIHLLLSDFSMKPHMNGCELAGRLRMLRRGIKVMYISGFVDDDILQKEVDAAYALFLPKPFTPQALIQCVRQSLGETIGKTKSIKH